MSEIDVSNLKTSEALNLSPDVEINGRKYWYSPAQQLAAHIVKKYSGSGEADDLISVGSIGLIKAINSFEYGKGTQLSTYAARCIENEILMLLRLNKKHKKVFSLEENYDNFSDPEFDFAEDEEKKKSKILFIIHHLV